MKLVRLVADSVLVLCLCLCWVGVAHAQFVFIPNVPDANQPPPNNLNMPATGGFCAPTSAANVTGYWDVAAGHANAASVNAGLAPIAAAEYISWFMATNGGLGWGRLNVRVGGVTGTHLYDIGPGLWEYARWDGCHPFPGPGQPARPAAKNGYTWKVTSVSSIDEYPPTAAQAWSAYMAEIDAGRPTITSFTYWNPILDATVGEIDYHHWGQKVTSSGGSDPTEQWSGDVGHAVTGVGYQLSYDPDGPGGAPTNDWIIVHDNWPTTPVNVAIPFFTDYPANTASHWMAHTFVDLEADYEPEIAEDSTGTLHAVWWTGADEIWYAGGVSGGSPPSSVGGAKIKDGRQPAIAVDTGTDDIHVCYSSAGEIWCTVSTDGGASWSTSVQVSSTTGSSTSPTMVVDSSGNVHAAWEDDTGGDLEIWSADKPFGLAWGNQQQVTANTVADSEADMATGGTGVHLVWNQDSEIYYEFGAVASGDVTWDAQTIQNVDVSSGNTAKQPAIAVGGHGNVHVVWADDRGGSWEIYYRAKFLNTHSDPYNPGGWMKDYVLEDPSTGFTFFTDVKLTSGVDPSAAPDIAAGTTYGTWIYLHVTWEEEAQQSNPANYDIHYKQLNVCSNGLVNGGYAFYPPYGLVPSVNLSNSPPPSLAPSVVWGGSPAAVQVAWAESIHLYTPVQDPSGNVRPVIPPLLIDPSEPVELGVPFEIEGWAHPGGTGAGVEIQLYVNGAPQGPPLIPSVAPGECGHFSGLLTLDAQGLHEITATTLDWETSYVSEPSTPVFVGVGDFFPPEIDVQLDVTQLWPPNHRMVDVAAQVTASDESGPPTVVLLDISCDEPDDAAGRDDGETLNDVQGAEVGAEDYQFSLRAERDRSGSGRTYTVTYSATDVHGNVGVDSATVEIPVDHALGVEPVLIEFEETLQGTLVEWTEVSGASYYHVIRGALDALAETASAIDVGPVTCVKGFSTGLDTSGYEDSEVPPAGDAFLYLVEYHAGLGSSYGTETATKPRVPSSGSCEEASESICDDGFDNDGDGDTDCDDADCFDQPPCGVVIDNAGFESPPGSETVPDDFTHFTKNYRGNSTDEAGHTCVGALQEGRIATDHGFEGDQAVYLYSYSGNPASTPLACHRESGMQTVGSYDLTDSSMLSVWVTDFGNSSAVTCEYVRTRFRLEDGSSFVYMDLFAYGQYMPTHPNYDDHVETATGTDGRAWRRFQVDIPEEWRKPDVQVTVLTTARSWCAGWTVHSEVYVDLVKVLP